VHALETAFVADISPEILQALLNLAGFLERDSEGGLPIDITILADLALKCRAYAKALHYKEREYRMGGASSCVESLISINRKLDLQGEFFFDSCSLLCLAILLAFRMEIELSYLLSNQRPILQKRHWGS